MSIRFERRPGAALCYHVLAHLPLGPDAASLHDASLPTRGWVPQLLEAYQRAPGRLRMQTGALLYDTPDAALRTLGGHAPFGRDDAADRALAASLRAAMEERAADYLPTADEPGSLSTTEIGARLAGLRAALWETNGTPPPLTVVHVPALGHRGRATHDNHGHVVGTSLAEPPGQVLCVLLHEETHPRTDGAVLTGGPAGARDTRVGSPGFALHQQLEDLVIEVDRALLEARAPELLPDYSRWLARIGHRP